VVLVYDESTNTTGCCVLQMQHGDGKAMSEVLDAIFQRRAIKVFEFAEIPDGSASKFKAAL
jgi:hypothetical protein